MQPASEPTLDRRRRACNRPASPAGKPAFWPEKIRIAGQLSFSQIQHRRPERIRIAGQQKSESPASFLSPKPSIAGRKKTRKNPRFFFLFSSSRKKNCLRKNKTRKNQQNEKKQNPNSKSFLAK
jgi:hypothetical protein